MKISSGAERLRHRNTLHDPGPVVPLLRFEVGGRWEGQCCLSVITSPQLLALSISVSSCHLMMSFYNNMIPRHYDIISVHPRNIMFLYLLLDLDLENHSGKCNHIIVFPYSAQNSPNLIFTISVELRLAKNSSLSNC